MYLLSTFIPIDRRRILFREHDLPVRAEGSVLLVDMAHFTPLCHALIRVHGPEKGTEEITRTLSLVFTRLIAEIHAQHGSVVGFSGDALTAWFGRDNGRQAVACGLAMQAALANMPGIALPNGEVYSLAIKVSIANGEANRLLLGDPAIHYLELLAGGVMGLVGMAARHIQPDEVMITGRTAANLGDDVDIRAWREMPEDGTRMAIIGTLRNPPRPQRWEATLPFFKDALVRPWILPNVYKRLQTQSQFTLSELRPVTSVFVGLEEGNNSGNDYAWLDGYVRWVQSVAQRYDGTLLNIHNDDKGLHLHLTFGAPVAHSDDVLRALNVAHLLCSPPEVYPVRTRIGVASGWVYAGVYGSMTRQTYDVIGNSVNLAAYFMSIARAGEILCDEKVQQTASKDWRFEQQAPVQAKGQAEPMAVYRSLQPLLGEESDMHVMVGREQELEWLHDDLNRAIETQNVYLTTIEGEAGIGKSCLLRAWLDEVSPQQATVLLGSGQSIEQQMPYRAWREVLSMALHLQEEMSQAQREAQVSAFIQAHLPEQKPRLPLLNDLLGIALPENALTESLSPELRQQNLALLTGALLNHLASEKPLIVVFEDIHWMDLPSWGLLQQVVNRLRSVQRAAHFVLLLRPLESNNPLKKAAFDTLCSLPNVRRIALRSLPPHVLRALISQRLGVPINALPEPLIRLVQQRTEGNPFYAEELLHTLQSRHILWVEQTFHGPRCILSADFERHSQTIHPTLEGLILARIDSLPPERQLVLKVASVIGRTFSFPLLRDTLRHVLPSVIDNLAQELANLSEQGLTQLENPVPNLAYVFKHVITQEMVYQTMLFSQRRELHRLVAEWYEQHFPTSGEDVAGRNMVLPLLVHHYHHAEEPEKERLYARLAGEQALKQHAHNEALIYFRRCLALTPPTQSAMRFEILLGLEEAYHWLGNRPAQKSILQEMETSAAMLQRVHWQARTALRQARYARVTGQIDEGIQAARLIFALFPQQGHHEYKAEAHFEWGYALWQKGRYDEAMQHLEEALKLGELQYNSPIRVQVLKGMGAIYNERGQNENAQRCYQQALKIAHHIGDQRGEAAALGNLGNVASDMGDHFEARDFYLQALGIYRQLGEWRAESMVLNNLGALAYYLGRYSEAQDFYEQSLHIKWKIEDRGGGGMTYANLSGLFCAMGDYGNALAYNDKALEILRNPQVPFWEALTLQWRGDTLLAQQNWQAACQAYRQAIALRENLGHQAMLLESMSGLAAALLGTGNTAQSGKTARQVIQALQNSGALEGAVDPLRVYWRLTTVLYRLKEPLASTLLARSLEELQRRAQRIPNQADREVFLHQVPEHRALLALQASHLDTPILQA